MSPSTRSALERIAESDRDKDDGAFRSCYEMGVCETARLHPCESRAHLRAPCGLPMASHVVFQQHPHVPRVRDAARLGLGLQGIQQG